jgi:hypothetical protein
MVTYRAAEKVKYDFFIFSMKFPIDRIIKPNFEILGLWPDHGRKPK